MKILLSAIGLLVATAVSAQGAPVVNESTGDLAYTYAFKLPQARGRYQPELALVYSSAENQDAGYGHGWTVTGTYVEKNTRGSPDKPTRWLVHGKDRKLLVRLGQGYRPEVEESFFEVTPDAATGGSTYTALDANGTTYTFGRAFGTRAYLTRVADLDGNVTELAYDADKEDAVEIRYNTYGSAAAPAFATKVTLEFQQDTTLPPAAVAGLLVDRKWRLYRVRILGPTGNSAAPHRTIRGYQVGYRVPGPALTTSVETIAEWGGDFVQPLPATKFTYAAQAFHFAPPVTVPPPDMSLLPPLAFQTNAGDRGGDWIDIDGDGKVDLVWWYRSSSTTQLYWARNSTPLGGGAPTFAATQGVDTPGAGSGYVELVDYDGDGVMDLVRARLDSAGSLFHDVYRGKATVGGGTPSMVFLTPPVTLYVGHVYPRILQAGLPLVTVPPTAGRLVDLNGDGVLDYARAVSCTSTWCTWEYGLTSFDPTGTSQVIKQVGTLDAVPGGAWFPNTLTYHPTWLGLDFNGDGLPDSIWNDTPDCGANCYRTTGKWTAALNDGLAFGNGAWPRWLWGDSTLLEGYADSPGIYVDVDPATNCSIWPGAPGVPTRLYVEDKRFVIADLVDLNGDGRPDFYRGSHVLWNHGRGFDAIQSSTLGPYYAAYDHRSSTVYEWNCALPDRQITCECDVHLESPYRGRFADLNGDGIPDFVHTQSATPPAPLAYYEGSNGIGFARPMVLTEIESPGGATHTITYTSSSVFGAPARSRKPVVTALSVGGERVAPNTTFYWYEGPAGAQAWYDPVKFDDRGFSTTWSQDATTKLVRWTAWMTDSHALIGRPAATATGVPEGDALGEPATTTSPGTRPAVAGNGWFARQVFTYGVKQLTAGADASCVNITEPRAQDYPLRVIPTQVVSGTYYPLSGSGSIVESSVTSDVSCTDVDLHGNVFAAKTTPRLGGAAGQALVTRQSFSGTTLCKNVPIELRVTRWDASGNKLAEEVSVHDAQTCKVLERYAPGTSTAKTNRVTYTYNAPFRLMDTTKAGGTTKRFAYDGYALNVTQETTEDGLTTLSTTYTYDPATGYRLSSSGSMVLKKDGVARTSDAISRYYLYDALGRTLAVAKQPFTEDAANSATAGLVPRAIQANSAVEAYQYLDSERPRKVGSYRFSVARSYSAVGAIPEEDDVAKTVTYFDGLGRAIQQRERLGGGVAALPGARVTQTASGYKVSKAVILDGAGRARVSLDPFYENGEAFVDYTTATSLARRGTVTSYDERGRPRCTAYQYISGAPPGAAETCVSDSSHSPSFRLATRTSYTARTVSQRGPYLGLFVATEVIPPDVNAVGGTAPRVALLGAAGEELGAIDGDGNYTWVERDALGREVASWREAANRALSTPQPASTIRYSPAGQVVENWDANSIKVTRQSRYDEAGRLAFVTTDPATGEGIEYAYGQGDLGRVTEIREVSYPVAGGAASEKLVARNHYDVPYNGADPGYSYLAGKLAWTENGETTIAYGYDDAGRVWRRDQWFKRLDAAKRFTMSSTYGTDGRVLDARVVNPYSASGEFLYQVDYDSAGRPVALSGKLASQTATTRYYEAASPGPHGAYDALGRIPVMRADNGLVVSARRYSEYSGRLLGECKRFDASVACAGTALDPGKDIYRSDPVETSYQGGKLKSYTDSGTGTQYANAYLPSGRLQSAEARPLGAVALLTQDWLESFAHSGIGNLEQVVAERNRVAPGAGRPYRKETEWYTPESPAAGQALDRVAAVVRKTVDAGGALMAETGAGSVSYQYDLLGHLTQVTRSAGESESLFYGPGGELVGRQIGERFVFYVGEYATVTASGMPGCGAGCIPLASTVEVDSHVVFAGTRIASVKPSRTLYYYRTRLGTVIATSLGGGLPGAGYRYTPYGEVELAVNETEATRSELGYTNALRLTRSLLHLKNRVYDAEGRVFLQADTVDRLRYAYVWGDPVNLSDPTGLLAAFDSMNPMNPVQRFIADAMAWWSREWFSEGQRETEASEQQTKKETRKEDATALQNEEAGDAESQRQNEGLLSEVDAAWTNATTAEKVEMVATGVGMASQVIPYAGDYVSLGASTTALIANPSWSNLGNVGLDAVGAALPLVPALGTIKRAEKIGEAVSDAQKLRKEFDTVRTAFWKSEAAVNGGKYSAENLARMKLGKPPIAKDGFPLEIHHKRKLSEGGTNSLDNLQPMTRTDHRLGNNYARNHEKQP